MTKEEFQRFRTEDYPETPPINYLFKHHLKSRRLRIHSLPESKRYAETKEERAILLHRQNAIIDDLVGQNTEIKIVVNFIEREVFLFKFARAAAASGI